MTRIEKYRKYREEISNMKFDVLTQKKEAAEQINKLHNFSSGKLLNYEEVMEVHEVFDDKNTNAKHKKYLLLTKFEIIYSLIAFIAIVIILVAAILVGNHLWG